MKRKSGRRWFLMVRGVEVEGIGGGAVVLATSLRWRRQYNGLKMAIQWFDGFCGGVTSNEMREKT